jgi:glycosyltransferase involved in cell wall biosynthesis
MAWRSARLMRPVVLHLSADFPDTIRDRTTPAIRNLLMASQNLDHVVVSLFRKTDPRKTYWVEDQKQDAIRVFAYGYWGLPAGFLHLLSMFLAARQIFQRLNQAGIKPDVIHAHKWTFEGVMAFFLARWWKVPYVLSIRGEVETKIMRFKPLLRPLLRHVLKKAGKVYFVSAWYRPFLTRFAPPIEGTSRLLPNFVRVPGPFVDSAAPSSPHFVCVLDLGMYQRKGFHWLVPAFAAFVKVMPQARLDVIGWSDDKARLEVEKLVQESGAQDTINFLGPMSNIEVQKRLPDYTALVLPSVNETFGMAYVEALYAGLPVLYTKDTGIDGYLDGLEAGYGARQGDVQDITLGLRFLAAQAGELRMKLAKDQDVIRQRFIAESYVGVYENDMISLSAVKLS